MSDRPRPDGFDYHQPDPEDCRCIVCNLDGMNRSGLYPFAYVGSFTTLAYAIACPNALCKNGLVTAMTRRSAGRRKGKEG